MAPEVQTAKTRHRTPRHQRIPRRALPPLSLLSRVLLQIVGWGLVLLGVIGWFLPVLQGWLTLFVGLAVLSVANQTLHRFLRRRFRGWPQGWRRLQKARRRIGQWLARRERAP